MFLGSLCPPVKSFLDVDMPPTFGWDNLKTSLSLSTTKSRNRSLTVRLPTCTKWITELPASRDPAASNEAKSEAIQMLGTKKVQDLRASNSSALTCTRPDKIWHNLFCIGEADHEEHPFLCSRDSSSGKLFSLASEHRNRRLNIRRFARCGTRESSSVFPFHLCRTPLHRTVNTEWIRQLPGTAPSPEESPRHRHAMPPDAFSGAPPLIPDDDKNQSGHHAKSRSAPCH